MPVSEGMASARAYETAKRVARRSGLPYLVLRAIRRTISEHYGRELSPLGIDQHYLRMREAYVRKQPELFSAPGVEARALSLLRRRWPGPREVKRSSADVRIFAVDHPTLGGPTILPMLARDFDTVVFNVSQHQQQYLESNGRADPIDSSSTKPARYSRSGELTAWRERLQRDLMAAIGAAHAARPIDLIFAYLSPFELTPGLYAEINSLGIPVAVLWLDDKHVYASDHPEMRGIEYPMGQKLLVGSCDVHLTNSREVLRWYVAEGAAAYYLPQGVDPDRYAPRSVPRDIPVSFIGGGYGKRADFVRSLLQVGLPIHCYGRGWEGGPVADDIEIYCRSRVNLGIGYVSISDRITCIKGRDFEVPSTGSLYLTTYDPELCDLFEVGREIGCYRNELDCAESIRYYLDRADLVDAIGRAGRARCLRDHTWTARIEGLLRWMGILA